MQNIFSTHRQIVKGSMVLATLGVVVLAFQACGSSSSEAPPLPENVVASSELAGSWKVTHVTCNGASLDSSYIPAGGQLLYQFDGASTLLQMKSTASCAQTIALKYTYDGTSFVVPAGSTYTVACSPAACTGTGLMGAVYCGTNGSNMTSTTMVITSFMNGVITARGTDGQATAICSSYSGVIPFTLSMMKQ